MHVLKYALFVSYRSFYWKLSLLSGENKSNKSEILLYNNNYYNNNYNGYHNWMPSTFYVTLEVYNKMHINLASIFHKCLRRKVYRIIYSHNSHYCLSLNPTEI